MYIGEVGGIKLKLNNLFLLLIILMFFFGMVVDSILIFMVVIVHELGHVIMAKNLKYHVESIELLPIGGVATINESHYRSSSDEWFIAWAGPFNNLLFIIILLINKNIIPYSSTLIQYNLTLFFFNLLPALPLDGGRLLKAYLSKRRSYVESKKIAAIMGIIIGVLLTVLSVYYYYSKIENPIYLSILGIFLTLSAIKELKGSRYLPIRLGLSKEERIDLITEGKVLICPLDTYIKDLIKELETNRELIICIIDSQGEVIDMITERIIVEKYNQGYGRKTLEEILKI